VNLPFGHRPAAKSRRTWAAASPSRPAANADARAFESDDFALARADAAAANEATNFSFDARALSADNTDSWNAAAAAADFAALVAALSAFRRLVCSAWCEARTQTGR
jgi:hypothetical protein